MTAYEIITKKRDGGTLSREEIAFMIQGYTRGEIPDYQVSAWLMAIFLRGMDQRETRDLTEIMLHSGIVADLSHLPGIKVDKHSTGGVGDKVSIILAPIVAAAGVPVPMISGRGLGHTGGTLDKLESIPGFNVNYSIEQYASKIAKVGACLIGQTPDIVPADKKLYALRDVTATIQSIPLITASIMSKKLAEGIDALVLDVKTGRGAFMQKYEDSVALAKQLISVGEQFGKPTVAYITDMNEPLGYTVGNWLEIVECIDALKGKGPEDLMTVTHQLCGAMIYLGGKADSIEKGMEISRQMITEGKAWDKFLEIVQEQEGDVEYILHPEKYSKAAFSHTVTAPQDGFIQSVDALEVGLTAVTLGAGRSKAEDTIDPTAGIILHKKKGQRVKRGEAVLTLYTNKEAMVDPAARRLAAAIKYTAQQVEKTPLIYQYLDKTHI